MKPITVWLRFDDKTKRWNHNHIEDGHITANKPTGNKEQNRSWGAGTWMFRHKYLDSNYKVISRS